MQRRYLNEVDEGAQVSGAFVLRSKELRAARTGDAYLAVELADKTAALGGIIFRPSRVASEIPVGAVVEVSGVVSTYRGARRISLDDMKPAARWDAADLVGSSPRPVDEMLEELRNVIRSVETPYLRRLLRAFFADKQFRGDYAQCPGAQSFHHAYLGGLLEHSLSVASHGARAAETYRTVDRDLLVTAALLHDVGKIKELSFHTGIEYTQAGRLIGHVVLGVQMVQAKGVAAGIDPSDLEMIEHVILSHHGEPEWGSPKRPSTIEALLLHHLDNLDAKAAGFERLLSGAASVDEGWTDAGNSFGRPLHAPRPIGLDGPSSGRADTPHIRLTA